jgi:hypothetical protein
VQKISLKELGDYIGRLSGAKIVFDDQQADYLKREASIPITETETSK